MNIYTHDIPGFTRDDINRTLFQLVLDSSISQVERLASMLLCVCVCVVCVHDTLSRLVRLKALSIVTSV